MRSAHCKKRRSMDSGGKKSEDIPELGFQLTPEEATIYMKSYPNYGRPVSTVTFVGTKTLESSSVYGQFYEINCDGTAYYISPVDGYVLAANQE
ncbi:hypothetical protein [Brevibacillus borstelensis]|uniref:hypothetical protein n=1 Tax=Brevibacillus borstelensis TaxID=45462 RepID=UPI0030BBAEE1